MNFGLFNDGCGGFAGSFDFVFDIYVVWKNFASAKNFQQHGVADFAHLVELGKDGDVLADEAVVVEVAVDGDFGGFDADVLGGKLKGLVEGAFQFLADDGEDAVGLGLEIGRAHV